MPGFKLIHVSKNGPQDVERNKLLLMENVMVLLISRTAMPLRHAVNHVYLLGDRVLLLLNSGTRLSCRTMNIFITVTS